MSKLEFYARPLVAFDATNKEHRRFYHQFVQTKSWGHCPVRFIVPEATGSDLIKMIQTEMINYYVTKEFNGDKSHDHKPHRHHVGLTSGGFGLTIES
jgi:hypothetical protein